MAPRKAILSRSSPTPSLPSSTRSRASSTSSLPRDIRDFLACYPSRTPSSKRPFANLSFYQNASPALPSSSRIDQLHASLRGNYRELEGSHSFIQWLFPIREMGMNWASQPLEPHEIDGIKADPQAMDRLLESYRIMLDFYGMRLMDFETGEVGRMEVVAPSAASWRVRYANLSSSSHNYLRITRILKSLSEFGWEHLNAGWLLWFLVEQARGELDGASLRNSMDGYWRYCLRNEEERDWVGGVTEYVRKGGDWEEADYREALEWRKTTGRFDKVAEASVDDAADRFEGVRFGEESEISGEGKRGAEEAKLQAEDAKPDAAASAIELHGGKEDGATSTKQT